MIMCKIHGQNDWHSFVERQWRSPPHIRLIYCMLTEGIHISHWFFPYRILNFAKLSLFLSLWSHFHKRKSKQKNKKPFNAWNISCRDIKEYIGHMFEFRYTQNVSSRSALHWKINTEQIDRLNWRESQKNETVETGTHAQHYWRENQSATIHMRDDLMCKRISQSAFSRCVIDCCCQHIILLQFYSSYLSFLLNLTDSSRFAAIHVYFCHIVRFSPAFRLFHTHTCRLAFVFILYSGLVTINVCFGFTFLFSLFLVHSFWMRNGWTESGMRV